MPHRTGDERFLLTDRSHIIQGVFRHPDPFRFRNHLGSQITGRQTAACRRDIPVRMKRLRQHLHPRFLDPGFRRQIGTGGNAVQQAEPCQNERPRTLCADQLPGRIQRQRVHDRRITGDITRLHAAAYQHHIRRFHG